MSVRSSVAEDADSLAILREAWREGRVHTGTVIAEATSGNTGIAFAAVGRALWHAVRIYMPDWMSAERVKLIRGYGAEVVPVSAAEGGFEGSIALADAYAREAGVDVFLPHQFANEANAFSARRGVRDATSALTPRTELIRTYILVRNYPGSSRMGS